ncbi:MAG: DUF1573 domain-containing protein [Cytophagales bacterium]|nr:DUF1573 domain-containing protein [Cytophagales bacterium]
MKHLFTILLMAVGVVGFSQEVEIDSTNAPVITFTEKIFEFGEINQGDVVEHVFTFQNTGKTPLILTNVKVTCGCTTPNWSREPIAAGETSEILVRFNSRGKRGMQSKPITISSNALNNPEIIRIATQVKVPPPPPPVDPDN